MDQYIKTAAGSEVTDTSFRATSSLPTWQFTPLPLSQLASDQDLTIRRASRRKVSLHDSCFLSISTNFHLYTPASLQTLPTHLVQRILQYVQEDRGYGGTFTDSAQRENAIKRNPDETTLWAYSAILDPDSQSQSNSVQNHTLAIPTPDLLQHLPYDPARSAYQHPFLLIPKLYKQINPTTPASSTRFLTTLMLDGSASTGIDDLSIMALRWCCDLTILWTNNCKVTDVGVRSLAAALHLPASNRSDQRRNVHERSSSNPGQGDGRGMWRLRYWSLAGCRGVSDRSMRSFARWPGLVLLDVRDTSCTEVSIAIFNRSSASIFPSHAPFQPCTAGLRPLFSGKALPADILSNLSATLLASPSPPAPTPIQTLISPYIALHLVPTLSPVPTAYLPDSSCHIRRNALVYNQNQTERRERAERGGRIAHVGGGVGRIYGSKRMEEIPDPVKDLRVAVKNLPTVWRIDEWEERGEVRRPEWLESDEAEEKRRKRYRRDDHGGPSATWSTAETVPFWAEKGSAPRGYKASPLDTRGKDFTSTRGRAVGASGGRVENRRKRQEAESKGGDEEVVEGDPSLMMVRMIDQGWEELQWATRTQVDQADSVTLSSRSGQNDLIAEILSSQCRADAGPSRGRSQSFFRPKTGTAHSSTRASSPSRSQESVNPFRSSTSRPSAVLFPAQGPHSLDQHDLDFGLGAPKSRFGVKEGMSADVKRSGMRMFTGKK